MPTKLWVRNHALSRLALAVVGLSLASWSCGGEPGTRSLAPVAEWGGVAADDEGAFLVDFGVVPLGSKAIRTVSLANKGTLPLTVTAAAAARVPFGIDLPAGGLQVPVGGSVEIRFDFAPAEPTDAPIDANVVLATNGKRGDDQHRFHLVGRGAAPGFDCTPGKVEFGAVLAGTSKKVRAVCTNLIDVPTPVLLGDFTGRSKDRFSAQILDTGAIPDEPFEVAARGSVEIEIGFTAVADGAFDAVLPLLDGRGENELARMTAVATGIRTGLVLEPTGCLEFGNVPVHGSKELPYTLRNLGTEAAVVDAITVDDRAAAEVMVLTPLPITVQPGGAASVRVTYTPVLGGKRSATLTFHASDPKPDGVDLTGCATAFGGGPQLVCAPAAIDFGKVAVGMPVTRTLHCTNAGSAPTGQAVDPLVIDDVYMDAPVFQASKATIRNSDGTTGAKREGYLVDESFDIDVVHAPTEEGAVGGRVTIESAAAPGGALRVPVSGRGLRLPPCRFDLVPASLDFGVVDKGQRRTLSFTFTNTLQTESCLINDLRLSDDSDGAFSVTPIRSTELPAGDALTVPVTFAPTRYQPLLEGEVQFQISNPTDPVQKVPLRGVAARPCVEVVPSSVDFGKVAPGCRSRDHAIRIRNSCAGPVTFTGITVDEGAHPASFNLRGIPSLPLDVGRNGGFDLASNFAPTVVGPHAGLLRIQAGSDLYLVDLEGAGDDDPVQTDSFDGPPYVLRGSPADRNGDGRVDEKDISLAIGGTPVPPVSGTGARAWEYATADYTIYLILAGGTGRVTATYKVSCLP